ncbi:MAG: hypothetical protein RL213_2049, partial [Bacteroidota bacterium]
MANKLRQEPEEQADPKEKKETRRRSKSGWKNTMAAVGRILSDERTHKLFGLALLLGSVFLTVAFISNLFTWQEDQAVAGITSAWDLLTSPDLLVKNWLGKTGALMALKFQYGWFGIASFVFPFLAFLTGVRILWGSWLLPMGRTLRYSFFGLVWLSTTLGFILHRQSELLVFAGGYGYQMSHVLSGLFGNVGAGAVLLFSFVGFLVAAFNIPLRPALSAMTPSASAEAEDADETEGMVLVHRAGDNVSNRNEPTRIIELELDESSQEEEEPFEETGEEFDAIDISDYEEEETEEEETLEAFPGQEIEMETTVSEAAEPAEEGELQLEVAAVTEDEAVVDEDEELVVVAQGDYDPTLDLSSYHYPTLDLLENYGDKKLEINKEELEANKNRIVETLGHYNISIEKIKATIGPTVTLFEIVPQAGVRISKIKNLEDDIALSLSALGIRIIAPIPGRGTIGIEVPNQKPEMVPMKTVLGSEKFVNSEFDLPVALGKTISNEVYVADLTKMPHLLMAGATGQGKSVGLNAILVSLLYKKHPAQVKFVLVDPKKVELTLFKTIERHFLAKLPNDEDAIITDTKKVINTLNSLCIEMDQRYELLKDAQVRTIKEYNAKFVSRRLNPNNGHRYLPYIVLVVDEFADLIMTAGKEVETPIARLAQLARAVGIHLIIATQRPSVNIITGTIKANFPARIAFRVTSKIDSRTILDTGG